MKIEHLRKHWIWALFAFLVPTSIALLALFYQYKSTIHELGGSLNATFHSMELSNKDRRTIVVCIDDTTCYNRHIYLTPTFDNPAEFSLRDFSLIFEIETNNIHFIPSEFVTPHKIGENSSLYQYNYDVLQAHMDTKNPFGGFNIHGDYGRCEIISKVSFDGAEDLYEYRTDVWFIYNPNPKRLSFDIWKQNCKQKIYDIIEDKKFDVYYLPKEEKSEYQFDVMLSGESEQKHTIEEGVKEPKTKEVKSNNELVSFCNYSSFDAKASEDLDIEDYEVDYNDTTKVTLFFNHEIKKAGKYLVTYIEKKGLRLLTRCRIIELKEGQTATELYISNNRKKIGALKILHQVNPKDYVKIKKNYKGTVSVLSERADFLVVEKTDGNYDYWDFSLGSYNRQFENEVSISIYKGKECWINKYIYTRDGSKYNIIPYIVFILAISLPGLLMILGGNIKDEKWSWRFAASGLIFGCLTAATSLIYMFYLSLEHVYYLLIL